MLATTIHKTNTTPHHQVRGDNTRTCCLRTQQCAQPPTREGRPPETRRPLAVDDLESLSSLKLSAPPAHPLQAPAQNLPTMFTLTGVRHGGKWCSLERR